MKIWLCMGRQAHVYSSWAISEHSTKPSVISKDSQSTYLRPIWCAALVPVLPSCSLLSCRGAYRGEANPGAVALSIHCTDTNLILFHGNPVSAVKKNVSGRLQAFLHLELHHSVTPKIQKNQSQWNKRWLSDMYMFIYASVCIYTHRATWVKIWIQRTKVSAPLDFSTGEHQHYFIRTSSPGKAAWLCWY